MENLKKIEDIMTNSIGKYYGRRSLERRKKNEQ